MFKRSKAFWNYVGACYRAYAPWPYSQIPEELETVGYDFHCRWGERTPYHSPRTSFPSPFQLFLPHKLTFTFFNKSLNNSESFYFSSHD